VAVTGLWYYFAVLQAVPFWLLSSDYNWYSLSMAFTIESNMAGGPKSINHGNYCHPAIPFEVLSWIALRLTTLGISGTSLLLPPLHRLT
jgi:hypothetical protein